jgi:uncharacterized cofD-like protein
MKAEPSVVVMGGGTGTYMVLSSLKRLPVRLTALMTMVDDGGSNKILRDQFGLLPTSGIRQAIVALSENDSLLRELFLYRFHQGAGIAGMTFGNLFMAALTDIMGSQSAAIAETQKLLQVRGMVLPISTDNVRLVAQYEDGERVVGEHIIDEPVNHTDRRIIQLSTEPTATISPPAQSAIAQADIIIMGPGDFYTNTVANLVVQGVPEAIAASPARVIFVGNLMTKPSETPHYTMRTFLAEFDKYLGLSNLDEVLLNNNMAYPAAALEHYAQQNAEPVVDDIVGNTYGSIQIKRADLISDEMFLPQAGDTLARSMVRHDGAKFAQCFAREWLPK